MTTIGPAGADHIEPIVREATADDRAVIARLDEQGRTDLESQRGGEAWLAEHAPIRELFSDTTVRILVSQFCDVAVGFSVSVDEIDPARGRICRVDRVYVHERAREIGCGDALLAAEIDRARQRGCDVVEAVALPGDRETKNLYERAGITARCITVSKRISDLSTQAPASR